MEKDKNEILFNKYTKNGIIMKGANDAKKLVQLLQEHVSRSPKTPEVIVNLYSNKIQSSPKAIANKLLENKLRPFEFYIINN